MPRIYRWWMEYGEDIKDNDVVVNPEYEEKPITDESAEVSEDVHGGSEETFSMPSTGAGGEGNEDERGGTREDAGNHMASSGYDGEHDTGDRDNTAIRVERRDNGGGSDEEKSDKTGRGEAENSDKKKNDAEHGDNANNENNDRNNNKSDSNSGSENSETHSEDDEDANNNYSGTYNNIEVIGINGVAIVYPLLRRYFDYMIERIADEETKIEDPRGYDRYSLKMLMLRPYTGKSLRSCRVTRVREKVILILDNSGSMSWWSDLLNKIASIALKREDVEIYIAPNGLILHDIYGNHIEHDNFMKTVVGRTIIYVGDYDGANTPIKLSWRNRVYWICPEMRYRRFRSHNWVDYDEEDFKGVWVRVFDENDLITAFRKIMALPRYRRTFIDLHEDYQFNDDY